MTYLKQLYYLIDEYQKGRYNLKDFCDLFTDIFNFQVDKTELTEQERNVFSQLAIYTERFSPYEEDYPILYNQEQLEDKITWASKELN